MPRHHRKSSVRKSYVAGQGVRYDTVRFERKNSGLFLLLNLLLLLSNRVNVRSDSWLGKPKAALGIDTGGRYRGCDRRRAGHPTLLSIRSLSRE